MLASITVTLVYSCVVSSRQNLRHCRAVVRLTLTWLLSVTVQ